MQCKVTVGQLEDWLDHYLRVTYPADRFYVRTTTFFLRGESSEYGLAFTHPCGTIEIPVTPITLDEAEVTVRFPTTR